ncbi:MAG: DUF3883 domain-containing protein [Deltaproteobacteria bacterium]|nr:DUF3883 domain-containing protein [Deltaproteobacteria bacterium]
MLPSPDRGQLERTDRELGLTQREIDRALDRVGVRPSLARLSWDEVYELLLAWPGRDPDGTAAAALYRELLERGDRPESGPAQERFGRDGQLWGKEGTSRGYFAVGSLRYEDVPLPAVLSRTLRLVDLPRKRGGDRVARTFLVTTACPKQFGLEVVPDEADARDAELASEVATLKPWVLALRSHAATEPPIARLRDGTVHLCRRATAQVAEEHGVRDITLVTGDVVLSHGGHKVYAVVEEPCGGRLLDDPVIADVVGEAFAQLLGLENSADIARLAACRDDQRERFLAHLLKESREKVAALVAKARERLGEPPEAETGPPIPPPPPERPFVATVAAPPVVTDVAAVGEASSGGAVVPVATGPVGPVEAEPAPPDAPRPARTITMRVRATPRTGAGGSSGGRAIDPKRCQEVAERFEENQGRFPLSVDHLQGSETPRCDLLSFETAEARERCRSGYVPTLAARCIEVKGSSAPGGTVRLAGNELAAARELACRYFLYHVHEITPGHFELIALADPTTATCSEILEIDLLRSPRLHRWEVSEIDDDAESDG